MMSPFPKNTVKGKFMKQAGAFGLRIGIPDQPPALYKWLAQIAKLAPEKIVRMHPENWVVEINSPLDWTRPTFDFNTSYQSNEWLTLERSIVTWLQEDCALIDIDYFPDGLWHVKLTNAVPDGIARMEVSGEDFTLTLVECYAMYLDLGSYDEPLEKEENV